jgi:hypothetical protein
MEMERSGRSKIKSKFADELDIADEMEIFRGLLDCEKLSNNFFKLGGEWERTRVGKGAI